MKKILNKSIPFLFSSMLFLAIVKIFFHWISLPEINGGDWPYYAKGMFEKFTPLAPLWTAQGGIGLGGVNADFPIYSYLYFTIGVFVNILHFTWIYVYKVFWFWLPLVFGATGISYLYRSCQKKSTFWETSLAVFLYIANTYFLMLASGGQMGILLSYSVAPFVVGTVINSLRSFSETVSIVTLMRRGFLFGLVVSLEMLFDPRITYLMIGLVLLYMLFSFFIIRSIHIAHYIGYVIIGFATLLLIHSYWLLPFYFFKLLAIPMGITSSSGFTFFSFADFSHALSFLHPNWPENIFGKVHFLQPEFLLFPLLAFLGLLVVRKMQKEIGFVYLFFCFIALIGVFLAKGVNQPFGELNSWLFNHVIGFSLFRDPTKYYLFIAISYAVMIPLSLKTMVDFGIKRDFFQYIFFVLLLSIMLFQIRQALQGRLNGTFTQVSVPQDYIRFGNFLSSQPNFFRVLWIPQQSRFRFEGENHPVLNVNDIFNTTDPVKIANKLQSASGRKLVQDLSVKYIIIPYDSTGEIFLNDRKYDNIKRQNFIKKLDSISWLQKFSIGKIIVYEVPRYNGHFVLPNQTNVPYTRNSSSDYVVTINNISPQSLVFSEAYHPGWIGIVKNREIRSVQNPEGLNTFRLPAGTYKFHIIFIPEKYEKYFYAISFISFVGIMIFLLGSYKKKL